MPIRSWWKRPRTDSGTIKARHARPRVESLEGRVLLSGTPVLLKDTDRLGAGSLPSGLVEVGSTLLFTADDGPHGREVWRTDGTATGTFLLKDINPSGDIDTDLHDSAVLNGFLFFGVRDFGRGAQIWKTDGTAAGTTLLRTINPYPPTDEPPKGFVSLNGVVLFWAYAAGHGMELWRSDGTPAGTHMLKDIYPGPGYSYPGVYGSAQALVNNQLFFTAQDGDHGLQLWRSDGTAAGTRRLTDNPGFPYDLHAANNRLVFIADDHVHGNELWSSDGTPAGTSLVQDINPGAGGAFRYYGLPGDPDNIVSAGDRAFFSAWDGTHPYRVWTTDGTPAGTYQLADTNLAIDQFDPARVVNVGGTYYFAGSGGLWRSDGTPAGTALAFSFAPSGGVVNYVYGAAGSTVYFGADDRIHGNELWKTDGTPSGTALVKDIWPGPHFSLDYPPTGLFAAVNHQFFFTADDGTHGQNLWRTDGSTPGTMLLKDIWPGPAPADVQALTVWNDQLFFVASDPTHGPELWRTDGTRAGTLLVRNINTGTRGSDDPLHFDGQFGALHGTIYFSTEDFVHGYRIWSTDGSRAGTTLVKDLGPPNGLYAGGPGPFTAAGDYLFFANGDRTFGDQLWRTDGTEAGTVMVADLRTGANAYPVQLTNYNGTLYFGADGDAGSGLWKSDGTAAGTILVKPVGYIFLMTQADGLLFLIAGDRSGPVSLWVSDGTSAGTTVLMQVTSANFLEEGLLQAVGNTVFFGADTSGGGWGLWKTDGTTQGTVLVSDAGPTSQWSNTRQHAAVNSVLYYLAYDGVSGTGLWKSDGTSAGTVLLKDSAQANFSPDLLFNYNGTLVFSAGDWTYGSELWRSDGTPDGTVLVAAINPDPNTPWVNGLTIANGLLYFSADDGRHGRELWQSDGTTAGTHLAFDLRKEGSSSPRGLSYQNGALYFMADDGRHGMEPWVLQFPGASPAATETEPSPASPAIGLASDGAARDIRLRPGPTFKRRAQRLAQRDVWFTLLAKTATVTEPISHHAARHPQPADALGELEALDGGEIGVGSL